MSVMKRIWKLGSVTVATMGMSTCSDNGAVDPAPPPLQCDTVGVGQGLAATGKLMVTGGKSVLFTITTSATTFVGTPAVTAVTGGTAGPVTVVDPITVDVSVTLEPATTTEGTFTFTASVTDGSGTDCSVTRTFTFTIAGGNVTVALAPELPLPGGTRTAIAVVRRDELEVDLSAVGPVAGEVSWSVTGGAIDSAEPHRARWRLPAEPGLYQVELVVDRGRAGLSIDTLTLEVG